MQHFSAFCAKRIVLVLIGCCMAIQLSAVPAYPGWQMKTQPDGSPIKVRLVGDEFAHYWMTEDGKLANRRPDGLFERTETPVPTPEQFNARRAKARDKMASVPAVGPKRAVTVADKPNLVPKGLVILVNFADIQMDSTHTLAVFDNLLNAENCTTNVYNGKNYGSVKQYFSDQSYGAFQPQFDVYGPVTVSHPEAYYGPDGTTKDGYEVKDMYITDFVIEAVAAVEEAGCDFSQYDADNDGEVDFVFIIYAGQAEAYNGVLETLWPHRGYLSNLLYNELTHGDSEYYCNSNDDCNLPVYDGKTIDMYVCASELDWTNSLGGIGTICHEFSHVLDLPDFYDTQDNANPYQPYQYDLMANGNYNGDMHCPPYFSPWEMAFFGWVEPVNLGNEFSTDTLYAHGLGQYNVYQINDLGRQQDHTTPGKFYYLENRQLAGWDECVGSGGLFLWRVSYRRDKWTTNKVNVMYDGNTDYLGYTISRIFNSGDFTELKGRPLTNITNQDGMMIFQYMDSAALPVIQYEPIWNEWAYYCDSTCVDSLHAYGNFFYWGVRFPEQTLANDTLTVISLYETAQNNTQPIKMDIYSGGRVPQPMNLIYTETVEPAGVDGWHNVQLQTPVVFNPAMHLWIILSEGSDYAPAMLSFDPDDHPEGRWLSLNGLDWLDMSQGVQTPFTYMIRAGFGSNVLKASAIEAVSAPSADLTRKVLRNGQLFITLPDGKTYNALGAEVII